jgi:hypothetical protein
VKKQGLIMDKLKLIKGIVFVITFLLVFGSLLLLTVIYKKAQPQQTEYTETSLSQPQGSRIESIIENDGNLAILVKGGNLADRVIIYDPKAMKKVTTLNL